MHDLLGQHMSTSHIQTFNKKHHYEQQKQIMNSVQKHRQKLLSITIALTLTAPLAAQADLNGLGDLPGGVFSSTAWGVNDDGTVVVGYSASENGWEAFRWTQAEGMVGLGDLPGGAFISKAHDVSADGSVAVGTSASTNGTEAFRWSASGGMVGLGDLPGGSFGSAASGVSANGLVVVGFSQSSNGHEAFRWSQADGMEGLGDLPGGNFFSSAADISADGLVIVGQSISTNGAEAFRWTSGGGMVGLGDLSGGSFESLASGINDDGSVVVGFGTSASGTEAFRWTAGDGMVGLGDLPGGGFYSTATDTNADGTVVVGNGNSASGAEAFRWTQTTGMQSVADWLESTGVDTTGWATLELAYGVSADGAVVVGRGTSTNGTEAWLARAGSGVLTLNGDLTNSLGGSAGAPSISSIQNINLILHGAHHRPLLTQRKLSENRCLWLNGDFARYGHNQQDADAWLAELGSCYSFIPDVFVAGIGLGKSQVNQNLIFSGDATQEGQYLMGEMSWRPTGQPLIFTLTGLYGYWNTDIDRGYLNGGVVDQSHGDTDIQGGALRARIDWPIKIIGDIDLIPSIQYSHSRTKMDGYTETGGGFPARFHSQSHTAKELRGGLGIQKDLSPTTRLHADLEATHRFDDNYSAVSGQIIGLFAFNLEGAEVEENWVRGRLELDQKLSKNSAISASVTGSTTGEDPELSAAISLRGAF